MIVVMGATGATGNALVHSLLTSGTPVRALTRTPNTPIPGTTGEHRPAVEVRYADAADPHSLRTAFEGAGRLFLAMAKGPAQVEPRADRAGRDACGKDEGDLSMVRAGRGGRRADRRRGAPAWTGWPAPITAAKPTPADGPGWMNPSSAGLPASSRPPLSPSAPTPSSIAARHWRCDVERCRPARWSLGLSGPGAASSRTCGVVVSPLGCRSGRPGPGSRRRQGAPRPGRATHGQVLDQA
ncbi:SDR family oxidoreductase [Streptomyces sp. NPDC090036]|uniref:SDR family oxidoreductase n=1 Tax=Streptomyces sp. NPDC090036 TaxID=3365926 RepID=UPI0037F5C34A